MGDTSEMVVTAMRELGLSCVDSLDTPVQSVILHGSLTFDDFIPGRSDVDLLFVVDDRLTIKDVDAFESGIRHAQMGVDAKIDLHVVTADVATAPPKSPPLELYVAGRPGARPSIERGVRADPDLLVELSMARAHGRQLVGAEPRDVVGPVPSEWVLERGVHWLTVWKTRTDDRRHAELMVLTACRIWRFAVEGVHSSKTQAGRWALARDASMTGVRQALHRRTVDPDAPISAACVRRVLDAVSGEIA